MSQIKIKVLLFGACRETAGTSEMECEFDGPTDVATAWASLAARVPGLAGYERSALFAVNEEHARVQDPIRDGDTLAIFPPVSGG